MGTLTLTEAQIPSSCEVARVLMPSRIPWVCSDSPVTHTLEGRIYQCEDDDLVPIRLYICTSCAVKYIDPRVTATRFCLVTPLTEYQF